MLENFENAKISNLRLLGALSPVGRVFRDASSGMRPLGPRRPGGRRPKARGDTFGLVGGGVEGIWPSGFAWRPGYKAAAENGSAAPKPCVSNVENNIRFQPQPSHSRSQATQPQPSHSHSRVQSATGHISPHGVLKGAALYWRKIMPNRV